MIFRGEIETMINNLDRDDGGVLIVGCGSISEMMPELIAHARHGGEIIIIAGDGVEERVTLTEYPVMQMVNFCDQIDPFGWIHTGPKDWKNWQVFTPEGHAIKDHLEVPLPVVADHRKAFLSRRCMFAVSGRVSDRINNIRRAA